MTLPWSLEAEKAISRVPFFVRKRVRRRVEAEAKQAGALQVNLEHVQACQQKFLRNMADEVKGWQLETCFGLSECPHRAVDPQSLVQELETRLAGKNLREFLQSRVNGPLKLHHEFRVSLSACPNACSRPQIVDIGLIGAVTPLLSSEPCTQCGHCASVCKESAISLTGDQVTLNLNACLKCGDCFKVCPSGTIAAGARGYRMLLGGKLGRHPQLGRELPEIYQTSEIPALVERYLDHLLHYYQAGERFGDMLLRTGLPVI
jgi:anaerobic sulfite reductase subunit C